MRMLVLCRHAKSDWSTGEPDIRRPLNGRGEKDAPAMGACLRDYGFRPDRILSSPATRAHDTALAVAKELGIASGEVQTLADLYHGGPSGILRAFAGQPDDLRTIMVFGHNPTLESLAESLLGVKGSVRMPTAGMLCLQSDAHSWDRLDSSRCELEWFIIPRIIRPG